MSRPASSIDRVRIVQEPPLWCLYWVDPPGTYLWDREGIPTSPYLCGYLQRQDAEAKAAREGWEVIE